MRRFIRNLFTKPVTARITKSRKPARTHLGLESLETREVLNATVMIEGSVLTITGTTSTGGDDIEIRAADANSIEVLDHGVQVPGGKFPFSSPVLSQINVDGLGGGGDTLTVDSLPALVNNGQLRVKNVEQVFLGENVGLTRRPKFSLADIRSQVFVDHPNFLNIRNDGDATGKFVTVTSTSVSGLAPKQVSFSMGTNSDLDLRTGGGNDFIHVANTFQGGQMRLFTNGGGDTVTVDSNDAAIGIHAGDGDDTLNVAPVGRSLAAIRDRIDFFGEVGNDQVLVNDSNNVGFAPNPPSSSLYDAKVFADKITQSVKSLLVGVPFNQTALIGYTDTETVGFQASANPMASVSHVRVASTSAATIVDAGAENVIVGDGTLNGIANPVTVNRATLGGTLTIDDSAQTNSTRYTLGANSVTEPGSILSTGATANLIIGRPVPPIQLVPRLTINFNDNVRTVRLLGGIKGDNIDVAAMRNVGGEYVVDGGGGLDTLTGPNQDNFFFLTGANSGSMDTTVAYTNVESLAGNAKNDTFQFANGRIDGFLDGAGGNFDTLDYSLLNVAVDANLATGAAHDVGSDQAGRVSGIEDVLGGSRSDTLIGDGGNNILVGNAGDDIIVGGGGFDLLVGGLGKDRLSDSNGSAIYIGGSDGSLLAAFPSGRAAVLSEWARTDLPGTPEQQFVTKVGHLKAGGGLNGSIKLNSSTLRADRQEDTIDPNPASTAFDLFVVDVKDQLPLPKISAIEIQQQIVVN